MNTLLSGYYFTSGYPVIHMLVWSLCPDGNMHGIIYINTLGGLDLDGSMNKNLPYFVVENLATLADK